MPHKVQCTYCGKIVRYERRCPADCPDCYEPLPRPKKSEAKAASAAPQSKVAQPKSPVGLSTVYLIGVLGSTVCAVAVVTMAFVPLLPAAEVSDLGSTEADLVAFPELREADGAAESPLSEDESTDGEDQDGTDNEEEGEI